jgi:hypothetical protein
MCIQQIQDWQPKNGYGSLEKFVTRLKERKLTHKPGPRSLKGVSPALPFSDVTYRRYYDHVLGYKDFKEASKSSNKHKLYLGLLSGPLYFDTVLYLFRERLLDQISWLCAALGRSLPYKECECEAVLPPIQGDPFEMDEVRSFPVFTFRYQ